MLEACAEAESGNSSTPGADASSGKLRVLTHCNTGVPSYQLTQDPQTCPLLPLGFAGRTALAA